MFWIGILEVLVLIYGKIRKEIIKDIIFIFNLLFEYGYLILKIYVCIGFV